MYKSPCPAEGRALEGARRGDSRRSGGGDAPPRPAGQAPETSGAVGAVAVGWTRRSVHDGGPSRSASGAPAVRHQRWIPRSVHRGSTEQASNTARGTPKVRRTCGSNSTRQASVSRGAEARGSGGPRRSARPLFFQASANDQHNGRSRRPNLHPPDCAALAICATTLRSSLRQITCRALETLSPCGRGCPSEARAGEGALAGSLAAPLTRLGRRCARPSPPSPAGGEGTEQSAQSGKTCNRGNMESTWVAAIGENNRAVARSAESMFMSRPLPALEIHFYY